MKTFRRGAWFSMLLFLVVGLLGCGREPDPTSTPIPPAPTLTEETPPAVATLNTGDVEAYPPPVETVAAVTPEPYPEPITAAPTVPVATLAVTVEGENEVYLPAVLAQVTSTPLPPTATPTFTPSPTSTPIPTIDFAAVQSQLVANGQALAYSKIGFHVGVGGNRDGLGEWMRRHTEAGAPFFLKTVSDAGPLVDAQQMIRESGVPHVLVFRTSGNAYDTPNYDLPPAEAAREHWALHTAAWPPELDKELVWLETLNEVDKNKSVWLAEFALETAALAERDGFKWAAFGWSSGEPEPADWESPQMLEFLRLVASKPERLAIALHEYSYTIEDIADAYPYKVGRFQLLFEAADKHGIGRPTVLITEWGWQYQDNPTAEQAMRDIEWAAAMYAPYPEIKGAAIWYLGPGFGDIANQTQRLIEPVMIYNLTNYFAVAPQPLVIAPDQHRP